MSWFNKFGFSALLMLSGCASFNNSRFLEKNKEKTISEMILDSESNLGSNKEDYSKLEEIINEASNRIKVKKEYTREEALTILKTIHDIFEEKGYSTEENYIFNEMFKTKQGDCNDFSSHYYSIGERLNIPINCQRTSDHIFVTWNDDILWDTQFGKEMDQKYVLDNYMVNESQIKDKIYLKRLSKNEIIACNYLNLGSILFKNGKNKEALKYLNKGIELDKNYPPLYINKSIILFVSGEKEEAYKQLDIAESIDKNDPLIFKKRAEFYNEDNNEVKALVNINKSIELNPSDLCLLKSRGFLKFKFNDFEGSLKDYELLISYGIKDHIVYHMSAACNVYLKNYQKSLELCDEAMKYEEFHQTYATRGLAKWHLGNKTGAISDLEKALELNPESPFAKVYLKKFKEEKN